MEMRLCEVDVSVTAGVEFIDEDRDRDRDVLTDTLSEEQEWHTAGPVLTDTLSGEAQNVPVLAPPLYGSTCSQPWEGAASGDLPARFCSARFYRSEKRNSDK